MRNILLSISILLCVAGSAQDVQNYTALLLNLNGEGLYIRGTHQNSLEIPQSYIGGDLVRLSQGEALIMFLSGDEITINEGGEVYIPNGTSLDQANHGRSSRHVKFSHKLLSQSGAAYRLRGENASFPTKSKFIKPEEVFIRLQGDIDLSGNLVMEIKDTESQKVIFKTTSIHDTILYLSEVPFIPGRTYYWTLSGAQHMKPNMGVLAYSSEQTVQQLETFDTLQSNLEYIAAIEYYFDKGYCYKAYHLLQEAIQKYPTIKLYRSILNNLLSDQ